MMHMADEEWDSCILDIIMTQYALKSGLRKFRKRDEETVTKELTQLHVLETFYAVDATKKKITKDTEVVAGLVLLK